MSCSTDGDVRTYELQLPQSLFHFCLKLPADSDSDSDQLLSATNNKDEEFCIAVRKHGDQWINLSIRDVHNNLFECLPDRWRCSIKTITTALSANPCEAELEVKPDISEMDVKCTTGEESEIGRKLGRGCRRKRSTFQEMSSDYVMLPKRQATRSHHQVDPGVDSPSQSKTKPRGDVAALVTPGSDVPTHQYARSKQSSPETSVVVETNSETNFVDEPDHLVDDIEAVSSYDDMKTESFPQESSSSIKGQFDAEKHTEHVQRVCHRGPRNRKPYVAYEQVIIDNRAAVAALSKHEYHCALCPNYVCYTSKTLHNHVVFKHKMSSSAYQQLVASTANPVDTNTSEFETDTATPIEDPGSHTINAATLQKLATPAAGRRKKQQRRTLDSVEKPISCLVCPQQFVQRTSMIKHVKQMHMTLENTEEMLKLLEEDKIAHAKQLSPIVVECPVCSLEQRGKRIITHMKKMHANEPEFEQLFELAKNKYYSIRSKLSLAREPSERVSCPYCGRQFARVSMRGHIRYRCRSNSERTRLYNCNLCGYCTPYEDHLRTHKLQHPAGVKGFVCHVCGCTYRTRAGLMVHTRIKHNIIKEKPLLQFHCSVCRKTFPYSTQLNRHMSVHKVERNFECDICSRTFKDEVTQKRHRKTFHFNEYRYHCDKCGHGVEKRQYLERHKCGRVRHHKNRVIIKRDSDTTDTVTQVTQPVPEQTVSVFIDENGVCSAISDTSVALAMDASSAAVSTVNLGSISEWPGSGVEMTPKGIQQEQLLFVTGDEATIGPEMVYEEVVIPENTVLTMMCEAANASGENVNTLVIE